VWPGRGLIAAYRAASETTPRPVAFGVVAAAAGLSEGRVAEASLYEDASTVTTAAVRLLPVDAAVAARWLLDAAPLLRELAERAVCDDLPGGFAPALELRSLVHARSEGKLFAS
jgi:urease accessory protein